MTAIEKAVQWAIAVANDNSHGYSQANRWGNPDYDCSSFVISAWTEGAGVPVKQAGASYTGNMRGAFLACGFEDVTSQVSISSGAGVQAGDVLLNYAAHTCLAIGGGKVANCRTDEGHPQGGDQSGNEIRIQNYWNGSPNVWNCVLRYKGSKADLNTDTKPAAQLKDDSQNSNSENHSWTPHTLTMSNAYSSDCVVLQAMLNVRHFACGSADGFYGAKTQAAVHKFQQWAFPNDRSQWDGICGKKTWAKLLEMG